MTNRKVGDLVEFKDVDGEWRVGTLTSEVAICAYTKREGYHLTVGRAKYFIFVQCLRDLSVASLARVYMQSLGIKAKPAKIFGSVVCMSTEDTSANTKLAAVLGTPSVSIAPNGAQYSQYTVPKAGGGVHGTIVVVHGRNGIGIHLHNAE